MEACSRGASFHPLKEKLASTSTCSCLPHQHAPAAPGVRTQRYSITFTNVTRDLRQEAFPCQPCLILSMRSAVFRVCWRSCGRVRERAITSTAPAAAVARSPISMVTVSCLSSWSLWMFLQNYTKLSMKFGRKSVQHNVILFHMILMIIFSTVLHHCPLPHQKFVWHGKQKIK